ncbi:immunoglobulin-like domain-containing protein [Paenibacillus chartarius]|uniref:Immunoglobulin-like domain-containing protein n=1 Tax=Paenibacillus chartarius TaxID=747481 RepID=A0ABV6DFX6_9BACL
MKRLPMVMTTVAVSLLMVFIAIAERNEGILTFRPKAPNEANPVSTEVSNPLVKASMYTTESSYKGNANVTLVVYNEGPADLMFGADYSFEKLTDGQWAAYQPNGAVAFPAIGYTMSAGGRKNMEVRLPGLPPGRYRFIKEVKGDGTDIRIELRAEFDVVR